MSFFQPDSPLDPTLIGSLGGPTPLPQDWWMLPFEGAVSDYMPSVDRLEDHVHVARGVYTEYNAHVGALAAPRPQFLPLVWNSNVDQETATQPPPAHLQHAAAIISTEHKNTSSPFTTSLGIRSEVGSGETNDSPLGNQSNTKNLQTRSSRSNRGENRRRVGVPPPASRYPFPSFLPPLPTPSSRGASQSTRNRMRPSPYDNPNSHPARPPTRRGVTRPQPDTAPRPLTRRGRP